MRLLCVLTVLGLAACHSKEHDAATLEGAVPAAALAMPAAPAEGPQIPLAERTRAPEVDFDGTYTAPLAPPAPDFFALRFETRVYAEPNGGAARIGQLRAGGGVKSRGKSVQGAGCEGGFVPIVPSGFVCQADLTADPNHPFVAALGAHPADASQKLPYMYGTVKRGGPAYAHLPTPTEIAEHEPHLATHLAKWSKDAESGATYGQALWLRGKDESKAPDPLAALDARTSDPLPKFLEAGAFLPNPTLKPRERGVAAPGEVSFRNGVAFTDTFLQDGRRWGISTELEVLPVDRFRPIKGSDYHGVRIGTGDGQLQFPFALVRQEGRSFKKLEKGHLKDGGEMPYRAALALTGRQQFFDGVLHYETKDGLWADDRSVSRLDVAKKMPGWANAGEKWLDVNVTKQTLIAYEGQKPVYATLVSTGEAGLADPETTKSTTRGIFRIHTKYRSATMASKVSGEEFELRDVPYVQYFEHGYALHAAYWHDKFGMPKSHGCINLAPEDARRIFFFTEPQVPSTWHGAALANKGTVLFVHP